jgi:hypothetical protein
VLRWPDKGRSRSLKADVLFSELRSWSGARGLFSGIQATLRRDWSKHLSDKYVRMTTFHISSLEWMDRAAVTFYAIKIQEGKVWYGISRDPTGRYVVWIECVLIVSLGDRRNKVIEFRSVIEIGDQPFGSSPPIRFIREFPKLAQIIATEVSGVPLGIENSLINYQTVFCSPDLGANIYHTQSSPSLLSSVSCPHFTSHMQQRPTCTNVRIRSTRDAHKIFYAVQLRILPMITRRLDADERLALCSGCIYAWEERGPHTEITGLGIERFTEGRRWSPSRVRDVCSPKILPVALLIFLQGIPLLL